MRIITNISLGRSLGATLALALVVAPLATANAKAAPMARASHADTARFLAGLPVSDRSPLEAATKNRTWRNHAARLDSAWKSLDRRQLSKIRGWSAANLTDPQPTLFYMFSGPDYLYANSFFPKATTYVLAGLEPVGREPNLLDMSDGRRASGLLALQSSINTVINLSFFRTKEMRVKFRQQAFPGILPVLYTFMARSGKTIEALDYLSLGPNGIPLSVASDREATGVKITFSSPGESGQRTLYYFSTDISNGGLRKSNFLEFCRSLGKGDSFIKSASYLLHSGQFSDIRSFLLNNSRQIVQDDSGIPIVHFAADEWNRLPFGNYNGPIRLFAGQYQRGMRDLFRQKTRKPLNFGIGYRWRPGDSNLLLAVRKES
ncbi:MAG: hypothetical protein KDJ37_07695 [Hyphomicrobiaceae bacterium]|nr:hypothetical protein [Hyphomicrobiaceae bacterium]